MTHLHRKFLAALIGGIVLCASLVARADETCEAPPSVNPERAEIAVSLKLLEAELQSCLPAGSCSRPSLTWYGMTRVTGYVADPVNRDIVLFGTMDPAAAPLRIDDFAIALRNALHKYDERKGDTLIFTDPAVTIDPDPTVLHHLDQIMAVSGGGAAARDQRLQAWCTTCELPQTVRLMGLGPDANSHFGNTMYVSDLLMKHISNGTAPVAGLDSLSALALQVAIDRARQHQASAGTAALNRFWFYPGATEYLEDESAVVLARADVILRTEAEQVTRGARIAASGRTDPLAVQFACAFSKMYPQLTAADTKYPVYAELEALFRWVALARIMAGGSVFEAAGYHPDLLADRLVVAHVPVPQTVKGVAHVGVWDNVEADGHSHSVTSVRLPSCGGVSIALQKHEMSRAPDPDGQLPRVRKAVNISRPTDPHPLPWWLIRK